MNEKNIKKIGEIEKIQKLKTAIDELDGVPIPYNIIIHQLMPLREWCISILSEEK